MKAQHSEDFYRAQWDHFSKKYTKNDPEKDLELLTSGLNELPQEAVEVIVRIRAQQVYNFLHEALIGTMQTIKAIQSGKASLGYTSLRQEIEERAALIEEFEFDCLRLGDFKRKYIA